MATFRLPASILSQTFNEDGRTLSNRQTNNQTLIVETSSDDGFLTYSLDPDDPNDPTVLQPASLVSSNITAVELNGQRAEGAELNGLDFFVTRVRFNGEIADIMTIDVETGDFSNDSIFVVLNDTPFPNLNGLSRLESFIASASFSAVNAGPFRPGVRIDLNDVDGAEFTPTPIELGSDATLGTDAADELVGTSGADGIDGLRGNDDINGRGGADTLFGSGGSDTINGGGGRDALFGNSGRDDLSGGGGRDRVDGGGGGDTLDGGGGSDRLDGGGGRDFINGGGGSDVLIGGGGGDVLQGGRGRDELTGGGGRDLFLFARGDSRDVITDYRDNFDRIMIEDDAITFADLTITQVGDDARVRFANVTIDIEDTNVASLGASDFVFS